VLYNKYYGETERNLRKALETAEVMSPCVLWMDEIEKGLAVDGDDGGLSLRVLGTLLTWLSEKRKPVFTVATANDITRLPPEMVRKGRFDEIFFVDLPSTQNRRDILAIHLGKRGLDPAGFDLDALATAAAAFPVPNRAGHCFRHVCRTRTGRRSFPSEFAHRNPADQTAVRRHGRKG